MKLLKITLVLAGLVLGAALLFAQADTTLQKAIRKETVEGDLKGAIDLYQKAISQAGKDKATASQALLRLGDAYEKQGDKQARPAYERLVKEFGDSKEASQAKVKLAAMGGEPGGGRPATEQLAAHHWIDGFPTGTPLDRPVVPFGSATGELMLGDLVTGESRKLTQGTPNQLEGGSIQRTAISDDGKLVVYSLLDKNRGVEIRSVSADGSGMRTHLTRTGGYAMPIALSPDKKTAIVILSGAGGNNLSLSLLSLADNAVKPFGTFPITAPGSTAHFSPDGQQVALSLNGGDLVLTSADGSSARTLLSEPGTLALASTFWTPDGKGIVFLRQWLGKMAVWAIPAGGGTPRLLKADEGINQLQGLTRDGSLYYSTSVLENDIYSVQLDPVSLAPVGQPSRFIDSFATHNSEPSFSPDGKWIAWESDREGPTGRRVPTVIVRPAAGGEEKIVDATPYSIHWSPDSKALWKRGADNGRDIIQRVEVADGRVTELYRSPVDSNPLLSLTPTPDGNELLGFRCWILRNSPPKPCDFVRFDLRTKAETVEPLGEFPLLRQRPAISPDGKWLAAVGIRVSGTAGTLFVKPTAGGKLVELAGGTFSPGINQGITWTPDSKQIVYDVGHSAEDSELMTVSVDGGPPKALSLNGNRGTIDPSGRLAYVFHTTRKTNWVARNLLP